jgi:H+/Cl- antiporter ClcA
MNNVFRQSGRRLVAFAGWFACAVAIGIICGLTGCAFSWCVTNATGFRTAHSWMVFLLPLSGLIIVYMYRRSGEYKTRGTNLVLASINESEHIPFRQAPLIFISTVITHLFGGSSGREGAALQLGGSIAEYRACFAYE